MKISFGVERERHTHGEVRTVASASAAAVGLSVVIYTHDFTRGPFQEQEQDALSPNTA